MYTRIFDAVSLVPRSQKVLADNAQQPLARDLEFDATANWQYAIDPATLKFSQTPPASGVLPSPIFDSGLTPLKITVTACLIHWAIAAPTFAASPPTLPACTGPPTTITLTPYGVGFVFCEPRARVLTGTLRLRSFASASSRCSTPPRPRKEVWIESLWLVLSLEYVLDSVFVFREIFATGGNQRKKDSFVCRAYL